jgi:hypothetical protein
MEGGYVPFIRLAVIGRVNIASNKQEEMTSVRISGVHWKVDKKYQ